ATQPWRELGMSRATWYRQNKARMRRETVSSAITFEAFGPWIGRTRLDQKFGARRMMPPAKGPAGSAAATERSRPATDGLWFASATVTCSPSAAWRWIDCQDGEPISRAEHVARPVRLASCPASRPADAEREGRAKTFATEQPRGGWPSTTSRQRRVRRADGQGRMWRKCDRASRPRHGSSMTGERSQGKAPS